MSTTELRSPSRSFNETDVKSVELSALANRNISENLLTINSLLRKVIFVLLAAVVIVTGALVYQSNKSQMVPYVVQTDGSGHVVGIGLATQMNYDPKEKEIQYFIERFILDARTIPLDPVLAKQQLVAAASLTTQASRNKLAEELRKENITGRIGSETTQLQMISNVQQTADTYQVRWIEEVYNRDGSLKEKYQMVGSFTFELGKVKNQEEWRLNPLGIYVKSFSWMRELR